MLLLENISHSFGSSTVLDGLSLNVEKGEVACLVGASGSGKTTLLRLIAGLEKLQKGRITVGEQDVASGNALHMPPEKRGVGLVFQHPSLFPHLSVLENVMFGLNNTNKPEALEIAKDLLAQVHYRGDVQAFPHMLSGGQHQRVSLARALAPSPSVLLLDEPFANLDSLLRGKIREEVFAMLKRRGTTTIMVTHDPQEALTIADKVILLHEKGEIHQQGTPEEIYCSPKDKEVAEFFGEVNIIPAKLANELFGQNIPAGKNAILRPEMICVADGCKAKSALKAEVVSSKFFGTHHLLEAKCGELTLKLADFGCRPVKREIGDVIHLSLRSQNPLYYI